MRDSEINVDQLMYEIRDAVARQHRVAGQNGAANLSIISGTNSNSPRGDSSLRLQPEFRVRPSNEYHVDDFLKYHGEDFLRNAYRALLKREPDPDGWTQYLQSLNGGRFNKIDVLASMRYSPEGEAAQVKVAGLAWPATIRRLERLPIIGYLLQLLIAVGRLPRLLSHLRQSESYVLAQQQRIADHHNQVREQLAAALEQLSQRVSGEISAQILQGTERAESQQQRIEALQLQQQSLADSQQEFKSAVEVRVTNTRDYADQLTAALAGKMEERTRELSDKQTQLTSQTEELKAQSEQQNRELAARQQQFAVETEKQNQQATQRQQELSERIQQVETQSQELSGQQQELVRQTEAQTREAQDLLRRQLETRNEVVMQERRLMSFVDEVRGQSPGTATESFAELQATEEEHLLDPLYAAFEERFRGEREEIKDRLRVYLPILKAGKVVKDVLDIGSGRGEWLEILGQEGIRARGIDHNRIFIEQCRQRGLEVVEGEALTYLNSLPNESLSAVTSFHLVEHLPFEILIRLLDEIVRTLRSGGPLILETPNPENFMVGSCNFYADPTHRNPIPSSTLQFLLEGRGLSRIEVMKLRPWDEAKLEGDTELIKRFNEYFYSAPDYGIIGWKV